jgi:hypothetical protein
MRKFFLAAIVCAFGCAKGNGVSPDGGPGGNGDGSNSCTGSTCDQDGDGVPDGLDQCPDTPAGEPVNGHGCADSQLTPMLEPTFPPYGLLFNMTGDLGRAGGLTWSYVGINRGDLFHIWWILCDDPADPCGLSLDGAIDAANEHFAFDATDSDLGNGTIVFTNTTNILLANGTSTPLTGRLTLSAVDGTNAKLPFATVQTLNVPARSGQYGAEIKGTAFTVQAIAEVADSSGTYMPYQDYYDAQQTPDGGSDAVSLGGYFYDK